MFFWCFIMFDPPHCPLLAGEIHQARRLHALHCGRGGHGPTLPQWEDQWGEQLFIAFPGEKYGEVLISGWKMWKNLEQLWKMVSAHEFLWCVDDGNHFWHRFRMDIPSKYILRVSCNSCWASLQGVTHGLPMDYPRITQGYRIIECPVFLLSGGVIAILGAQNGLPPHCRGADRFSRCQWHSLYQQLCQGCLLGQRTARFALLCHVWSWYTIKIQWWYHLWIFSIGCRILGSLTSPYQLTRGSWIILHAAIFHGKGLDNVR